MATTRIKMAFIAHQKIRGMLVIQAVAGVIISFVVPRIHKAPTVRVASLWIAHHV